MLRTLLLLAQVLSPHDWQTQTRPGIPRASWTIEDGATLCTLPDGPRADLSSKAIFRNFDLTFDWYLTPGTNSGVKYLVFGTRPNPDTGRYDPDVPKALGLELQLLDDERVRDAKVSPTRATGALYLFAAPSLALRPTPGQWHTVRIRVAGSKIEHHIDGKLVLATDLASHKLRQAVAAESRPDIPKPHHIEELLQNPSRAYPLVLTHHGGRACFKNIKVN